MNASAFLVFCVCLTAQSPSHEQRIRTVVNEIIAADNRCDIEAVMACYAEDAMWLPPNEDSVKRKAAIRKRYEMLFKNYQPDMKVTCDEVTVSGDWAHAIGTVKGNIKIRSDEKTVPLHDIYMMVLRKSKDDKWQISRLMWHPAAKKADN